MDIIRYSSINSTWFVTFGQVFPCRENGDWCGCIARRGGSLWHSPFQKVIRPAIFTPLYFWIILVVYMVPYVFNQSKSLTVMYRNTFTVCIIAVDLNSEIRPLQTRTSLWLRTTGPCSKWVQSKFCASLNWSNQMYAETWEDETIQY